MEEETKTIHIPLKPWFRFYQQPLIYDSEEDRVICEKRAVEHSKELRNKLRDRLVYSSGGTLLLTGYRGVGKTSFINALIEEVRQYSLSYTDLNGARNGSQQDSNLAPYEVLCIRLSLARMTTAEHLMHQIVKRIHREVSETVYDNLSDDSLRQRLDEAYARTVFNQTLTSSQEKQWGYGIEAGLGSGIVQLIKGFVDRQKKNAEEQVQKFRVYDLDAVEYDVIEMARLLSEAFVERGEDDWRKLKIIFIFDELDKLDTEESKRARQVLRHLKNILTTTNLYFIFVAGIQLHQEWIQEDKESEDDLYGSIFSCWEYLPFNWNAAEYLCKQYIDEEVIPKEVYDQHVPRFRRYLSFVGKGVIRDIVKEFERFVKCDDEGRLCLVLDREAQVSIDVYDKPQQIIGSEYDDILGRSVFQIVSAYEHDRIYRGVYQAVQRIIEQSEDSFVLSDITDTAKGVISDDVGEKLFEVLVREDYLDESLPDKNFKVAETEKGKIRQKSLFFGLEPQKLSRKRKAERWVRQNLREARRLAETDKQSEDFEAYRNRLDEALEIYRSILEGIRDDDSFYLDDATDGQRSAVHYEYASLLMQLRPEYTQNRSIQSDIEDNFRQAIAIDPANLDPHLGLWEFYLWLRDIAKTKEMSEKLKELITTPMQNQELLLVVEGLCAQKYYGEAQYGLELLLEVATKVGENQQKISLYWLLCALVRYLEERSREDLEQALHQEQDTKHKDLVKKVLQFSDLSKEQQQQTKSDLESLGRSESPSDLLLQSLLDSIVD